MICYCRKILLLTSRPKLMKTENAWLATIVRVRRLVLLSKWLNLIILFLFIQTLKSKKRKKNLFWLKIPSTCCTKRLFPRKEYIDSSQFNRAFLYLIRFIKSILFDFISLIIVNTNQTHIMRILKASQFVTYQKYIFYLFSKWTKANSLKRLFRAWSV